MDDINVTVGAGMRLYACMACGHYTHADTASSALALMRCGCCGSSLMRHIQCEQDLQAVIDWRDTHLFAEYMSERMAEHRAAR